MMPQQVYSLLLLKPFGPDLLVCVIWQREAGKMPERTKP